MVAMAWPAGMAAVPLAPAAIFHLVAGWFGYLFAALTLAGCAGLSSMVTPPWHQLAHGVMMLTMA